MSFLQQKKSIQFSDFINMQNNRFTDICKIYLDGLNVDDIKYLKPEDFINLVPKNYHKHKLLMTIMVRRYIYNTCDIENDATILSSCECNE